MLRRYKMEIRVLRYFLQIADYESISRAAENLHITQPTLSRQIKSLEKEIGFNLFKRNKQNRKFILTFNGIKFYNRAKEIIQLCNKTLDEFSKSKDEVGGKIYIGAQETKSISILAKVFYKMKAKYPKLEISLFSSDASIIAEKLDKGIYDIALFLGYKDNVKYESLTLSEKDIWGLLTHKDNPLTKLDKIEAKNLLNYNEPFIIPEQALGKKELIEWLGKDNKNYNYCGTYGLLYNASVFVQNKCFSAITIDRHLVSNNNRDLVFIPLHPKIESEIHVCWKKGLRLSAQAQLFIDELKKTITETNYK